MSDQPTRKLNTKGHACDEQNGRYELHRSRNLPAFLAYLCCICTIHTGTPDGANVEENLDVPRKNPRRGAGLKSA